MEELQGKAYLLQYNHFFGGSYILADNHDSSRERVEWQKTEFEAHPAGLLKQLIDSKRKAHLILDNLPTTSDIGKAITEAFKNSKITVICRK